MGGRAPLRFAALGLRTFVDPPPTRATSYVRGSKIALVAVVLTLALVPDAVFTWLVVPFTVARVALGLADVWAALWCFDRYGAMVATPHEFGAQSFIAHDGRARAVAIPYELIGSVESVGTRRRRELKRSAPAAIVFSFGGVPLVRIETTATLRVGPRGTRDASTFFIPSDEPVALVARLRESAPPKRSCSDP